ncbi:MAG: aminomethyl-transferring glycine dehydrogenase subunit GcvPA [Desulfovibrio sp.]|jgi:glycine dehydrogenase subunit 1|nr:aminomethyl-transferring glycine dehydrogenase subunit GcvPA [Desulfovibrio sp.]
MPFIPHTPEDAAAMLERIGVKHLDDLFADIPTSMRPQSFALPEGLAEHEVMARLCNLSADNAHGLISFLGGGVYDHAVSSAVDALSSRGEFSTAYTPYQPEAAQGTLQAIFEYQTAVCRLLEMDVANASVYDGGSAVFEAAMMGVRATKRSRIIVDESLNPLYRIMLATLSANLDVSITVVPHAGGSPDMAALEASLDGDAAVLVVQNPTFFGTAHDFTPLFAKTRAKGTKTAIAVNPVMQSLLKTPGEMGADVAVAEGQSIGMPVGFGGPYLGIMACTKDMVRQMPGRIAGRTEDLDGRIGYVLTLQAREQHIRRAKATSNICSNQALCALRSVIHLSLLGPEGLTRTAELSMQRAREAAAALTSLPGVSMYTDAPYSHEFAVTLPRPASEIAGALLRENIVAGLPIARWYPDLDKVLLVACTEKTASAHISRLTSAMGRILTTRERGPQ